MVKLIKFAMIGGAATLLQFLLLGLFVECGIFPPTPASAVSYGLSAICNYLANYHFTFASERSHLETLPKFAVTVAIGLALNTTLFTIFLFLLKNYLISAPNLAQAAYLIAQVFATLLTLFVNFIMHKFWIYRR